MTDEGAQNKSQTLQLSRCGLVLMHIRRAPTQRLDGVVYCRARRLGSPQTLPGTTSAKQSPQKALKERAESIRGMGRIDTRSAPVSDRSADTTEKREARWPRRAPPSSRPCLPLQHVVDDRAGGHQHPEHEDDLGPHGVVHVGRQVQRVLQAVHGHARFNRVG